MIFLQIEVKQQNYLLCADSIDELLAYQEPTITSSSSKYVEGIINYKNSVIPLISIRKLLDFQSFIDEQRELIAKVQTQHIAWVKDFEHSLNTGEKFTKALDPHKCALGQWIDDKLDCLRCNNNGFIDILSKEVVEYHDSLHQDGKLFLENSDLPKEKKIAIIEDHAANTIKGLKHIDSEIYKLTSAFEQIIILSHNGIKFGLVVDKIDKTHELDAKSYESNTKNLSQSSKYIQFLDHYEINSKLMFSIKFTPELDGLFK
ncbi:MAG: hypothetical protein DRG78_14940 [Epsilonproteobacteria bacterium]|nr:MAG: hypothetical protein DRG78_14940 [Campylobacterota bacterium]